MKLVVGSKLGGLFFKLMSSETGTAAPKSVHTQAKHFLYFSMPFSCPGR